LDELDDARRRTTQQGEDLNSSIDKERVDAETESSGGYFSNDERAIDSQGGISIMTHLKTLKSELETLGTDFDGDMSSPTGKRISELNDEMENIISGGEVSKKFLNKDITTTDTKKKAPRSFYKRTPEEAKVEKKSAQVDGYETLKTLISPKPMQNPRDDRYMFALSTSLHEMLKASYGPKYSKVPELLESVHNVNKSIAEAYSKQRGIGSGKLDYVEAVALGDDVEVAKALKKRKIELEKNKDENELKSQSDMVALEDTSLRTKSDEELGDIEGMVGTDLSLFPGLMVMDKSKGNPYTLGAQDALKLYQKIQRSNNEKASALMEARKSGKPVKESRPFMNLFEYKKGKTEKQKEAEVKASMKKLVEMLPAVYEKKAIKNRANSIAARIQK
jgi:hypothetical protein